MGTGAAHTGQKWIALVAALAVSACGGGDDDGGRSSAATATATATATVTATATPQIEQPGVERMPDVEAGSEAESLPVPASARVGDPRVLHASFTSSQAMWEREFAQAGVPYRPARLVLFDHAVSTACGAQGAEVGPFYCPADRTVYLNSDFFDALARSYGLASPFAAGYITAHEVGHHVQSELGVLGRSAALDQRDPAGANARSVRIELQADCYAGVWLHAASRRGELSEADLRDILTAAAVVGDDFRRQRAGAELAPETWTHGSSAQRVHWLSTGVARGSPAACDTFSGD